MTIATPAQDTIAHLAGAEAQTIVVGGIAKGRPQTHKGIKGAHQHDLVLAGETGELLEAFAVVERIGDHQNGVASTTKGLQLRFESIYIAQLFALVEQTMLKVDVFAGRGEVSALFRGVEGGDMAGLGLQFMERPQKEGHGHGAGDAAYRPIAAGQLPRRVDQGENDRQSAAVVHGKAGRRQANSNDQADALFAQTAKVLLGIRVPGQGGVEIFGAHRRRAQTSAHTGEGLLIQGAVRAQERHRLATIVAAGIVCGLRRTQRRQADP